MTAFKGAGPMMVGSASEILRPQASAERLGATLPAAAQKGPFL